MFPQKFGEGSSIKLGNKARSKRNYRGARGKVIKEQDAKRKRNAKKWKGARRMGAGSIDPPNRASLFLTGISQKRLDFASSSS